MDGTTPPRQALPNSLYAYLPSVLPSWQNPTTVRQFSSGQSNPTYLLTSSSPAAPLSSSSPPSSSSATSAPRQVVLRAKPRGKVLDRTAHRVDREFGVLRAIGEHQRRTGRRAVQVPEAYALCEDDSVAGSAFYLMEYVKGTIFSSVLLSSVEPSCRRAYWYAAIRALAQLSSVPPSILPSALFPPSSKPFFARQVGTLLRISGVQAAVEGVGEILRDAAERAQVLSFLKDGAQVVDRWEGGRKAIVWGDGKIDNMVFAEGGPEVVGILDWELCAIGSPLSDLGNMLLPWSLSNAEVSSSMRRNLLIPLADAETRQAHSLPSRDELLDLWLESMFPAVEGDAQRAKRAELARAMQWIEVWIIYRLAIIAQGIQARVVLGQASSAVATETGSREVVGLLGAICVQKVRALRARGEWASQSEKARL